MLRQRPIIHCGILAGAAVLASLGLGGIGIAQGTPLHPGAASQAEKPIPVVAETEAFKQAIEAFREHLLKMREVIIRFHTGEDVEDPQWKQAWLELQAEGTGLHQAMVDAAIVEYKTNATAKKDIADFLFKVLDRNIKEDRFEGSLGLAQALLETNYPDPNIQNFIVMVAFALNDYETVKTNLDGLLERQEATPALEELYAQFDLFVADWQEEVRLREEDARGEPLPRVLLRTTKGDMEIELYENQAPDTVANFIHLAETGFYEHLTFHRVLEHFMAQTGCPLGDGTGDAGYLIYGEVDKPNARGFYRGTLGMALSNSPDSGGSQFFITFLPTPHLNGGYTAFGRVVKGIEVLANIHRVNPDEKEEESKESAPPAIPDEIVEIKILSKRDHAYVPNKVK